MFVCVCLCMCVSVYVCAYVCVRHVCTWVDVCLLCFSEFVSKVMRGFACLVACAFAIQSIPSTQHLLPDLPVIRGRLEKANR